MPKDIHYKTVIVSGSFDMLHSGHVTFLQRASAFGKLIVLTGSDYSITKYKGKPPLCNQEERVFMLNALKCVSDAFVNEGEGKLDFIETLKKRDLLPDIFIVNEDQDMKEKRQFCEDYGIEYIVLDRNTLPGLPKRSTTQLRELL